MPTDDLSPTDDKTRALTVGLVQAYVANNHVQGSVHRTDPDIR